MAEIGFAAFSFVVSAVYDKADSYVKRHLGSRSELIGAVKILQPTLAIVRGMLTDAERKMIRDKNSGLKAWLTSLKDAAYDADDVLDELEYEAAKQEIQSNKAKPCISRYFTNHDPLKFSEHAFTERIREIQRRFDHILSLATYFKLDMLSEQWKQEYTTGYRRRETTSAVDNNVMEFRQDQKKRVIDILLNKSGLSNFSSNNQPNRSVTILSIVGIGGIGKTTLAREVFHDEKIKKNFSLRIWVYVSEDFSHARILKDILDSWYIEGIETTDGTYSTDFLGDVRSSSLESLQKQVRNVLEGKRFFMVMDDVWNEEPQKWNDFKSSLGSVGSGSCILTTCRNQIVANIMSSEIESLEGLPTEEILKLFEVHALEDCDSATKCRLQTFNNKIAGKLHGNPLAAKTLGCMLKSDLSSAHWKEVLDSEIWQKGKKENEKDIMPTLMISYLYLPEYLKPCFAYCSLFPKGCPTRTTFVINTWIAQGLIQQTDQGESEWDIGETYLNELIDRSLLQMSLQEKAGDPKQLTMHDLIFDLAVFASKDDVFQLKGKVSIEAVPKTVRHLTVKLDEHFKWDDFKSLRNLNYLRSLWFENPVPNTRSAPKEWDTFLEKQLQEAKYLRVLAFPLFSKKIPDTIGTLKLLRYLRFGRFLDRKLPLSFGDLYILQCLHSDFLFRPEELPKEIENLRNLRWLWFGEWACTIPGLRQLNKLAKFRFMLEGSKSLIELQGLHSVEHLHLQGLEKVSSKAEAKQAALDSMDRLKFLALIWLHPTDRIRDPIKYVSIGRLKFLALIWFLSRMNLKLLTLPCLSYSSANNSYDEDGVLEGLQPADQIRQLKIKYYNGVRCPSWMMNDYLSNIMVIKIVSCRELADFPSVALSCKRLQTLELTHCPKLTALELQAFNSCFPTSLVELVVKWCGAFGNSIDHRHLEVLKSLKILRLAGCQKLEWLPTKEFLLLQLLEVEECPKLAIKRGLSGLEVLASLKRLFLKKCFELQSTLMSVGSRRLPSSLQHLEVMETLKERFSLSPEIFQSLYSLESLVLLESQVVAEILTNKCHLPTTIHTIKLIRCCSLESMDIQILSFIGILYIDKCPQLYPPQAEPTRRLKITYFSIQPNNSNQLKAWLRFLIHSHLVDLSIGSYNENTFDDEMRSILLQFQSLKSLLVYESALRSLPDWLSQLSSLATLQIENCPSIQSLPDLTASLVDLYIINCPALKRRLRLSCGRLRLSRRIPVLEIV